MGRGLIGGRPLGAVSVQLAERQQGPSALVVLVLVVLVVAGRGLICAALSQKALNQDKSIFIF